MGNDREEDRTTGGLLDEERENECDERFRRKGYIKGESRKGTEVEAFRRIERRKSEEARKKSNEEIKRETQNLRLLLLES
jgi:hypothetical protein